MCFTSRTSREQAPQVLTSLLTSSSQTTHLHVGIPVSAGNYRRHSSYLVVHFSHRQLLFEHHEQESSHRAQQRVVRHFAAFLEEQLSSAQSVAFLAARTLADFVLICMKARRGCGVRTGESKRAYSAAAADWSQPRRRDRPRSTSCRPWMTAAVAAASSRRGDAARPMCSCAASST